MRKRSNWLIVPNIVVVLRRPNNEEKVAHGRIQNVADYRGRDDIDPRDSDDGQSGLEDKDSSKLVLLEGSPRQTLWEPQSSPVG